MRSLRPWIITGIDTGVGKTIVSAILTKLVGGEYWKPIEAGGSDTRIVQKLLGKKHRCHPPAYTFSHPLSPHHAAQLEGSAIDPKKLRLPQTSRPIVLEGCGGILTPLTQEGVLGEVFEPLAASWIIVSRHYLGSLNHTLLTAEWLQGRSYPVVGIIFNGKPYLEGESFILNKTGLPFLGRLLPETHFTQGKITCYAQAFRPYWKEILKPSGTPSLKGG